MKKFSDFVPPTKVSYLVRGPTLHLRRLGAEDFEPLYAVASDPLVWEQHPEPLRHRRDVFEGFFAGAMTSRGALLVGARSL